MLPLIRILEARQAAQDAIHRFFRQRQYLSIDTPIMVTSPGTEVHLGYFTSEWRDFRQTAHSLYLRSSPELHLKQALALGLPRVYHLGKCFRNQGELADWHHPEFTMLEFYQTGISLDAFMDLTAELIESVAKELNQLGFNTTYQGGPIRRMSMTEAFRTWAEIELIDGDPKLAEKGQKKGFISIRPDDDFETAYFKILLDIIEPRLKDLGAVFLYDYPASQCALARVIDGKAKRFELYLAGVELCNAFDELLDPKANRQRIEASNQQRELLGHGAVPVDEDFLSALEQPLAPCCGNALGFDRLLAILLGEKSLDRVLPFRWNQPWRRSGTGVITKPQPES